MHACEAREEGQHEGEREDLHADSMPRMETNVDLAPSQDPEITTRTDIKSRMFKC